MNFDTLTRVDSSGSPSALIVTTRTGVVRGRAAHASRSGRPWRHGPHQVAHAYTTVMPRALAGDSLRSEPSSASAHFGAAWPSRFASSQYACFAASWPRATRALVAATSPDPLLRVPWLA